MASEDFRDSLRRAAQSETHSKRKPVLIAAMGRLSLLAGVLVALVLIPTTTIVAMTVTKVSDDVIALPLKLEDQPNAQTSRLLASNGDLIAYFYSQNRQDVPLAEIAPVMQDAIISIEDARFYEHGALDLKGTLRALVNNAAEGQTQGGSSITQQLVKQTLISQATTKEQVAAAQKQSVSRKIRELKLAIAYEEKHTKKEILERYLNLAYFGDGAYGISAAASHYFSKSPSELNARQAATLAGLVKNPVDFDPNVYPEKALQRRNTVLAVMERLGKITPEVSKRYQASALGLKVTDYPNGCVGVTGEFSCDYARRWLEAQPALGATVEERRDKLLRGGLTIKSNIDLTMQAAADKAVRDTVKPTDGAIGAMAMVEPGTGKVRAVAQSRPIGDDPKKGESYINFAVPPAYGDSGGFQAGSTFKMFTTAAALKNGIDVGQTYNSPPSLTMAPGSYFDCEGGGTGEWKVKNSTTSGRKNMYTGLRQSVNTYFAQLEKQAGLCNTVRAAESMGIKVPFDPSKGITDQVGPFTLGVTSVSPLDMAAAYATPASGGMYCKPRPVDEILDANGEVLKKFDASCERVLTQGQAAQINDILRGVQEPGGFGFSNGTGLNIPSAAKTGTTNGNQAVWYTGYTPELATASMVAGVVTNSKDTNTNGRPKTLVGVTINGSPLNFASVGGSSVAGPMWAKAMQAIQSSLSPVNFDPPPKRQPAAKAATKKKNDDD
ncbi:transglycosylase domain-containing protein [Aeromicrobium fastidiosum]|uniref:Penicillin-binding protein n=1 Tax=Aeromicrobium fastidiosum TaxID=52699 RepID=A0A641ARK2_9ACTN|nr:transglycosylase domain-containing protein [Aeromicrobium fastidiosum]KAA1380720.1 penicillin-binding protein [Aeromicrobium fastidiosum]MBP2390334.1 membrane peptidoglycan carboxypeptidase [Aeromicrobium fastidiosum]